MALLFLLKKGRDSMEEEVKEVKEVKEEKIIINENVNGKLKDFEKILKEVVIPIKSDAEFINQVLYAPLSDETKERIVEELHEDMKKRVEENGI